VEQIEKICRGRKQEAIIYLVKLVLL